MSVPTAHVPGSLFASGVFVYHQNIYTSTSKKKVGWDARTDVFQAQVSDEIMSSSCQELGK